ncbi:MAG: DUF4255 domain-containing protein, partial [Spirulinaceae cyanobacterium]
IAAVTTTLQSLLFSGLRDELGSGTITALPLDKARRDSENHQINLFLYHATPNPAWRNRPRVAQVKRGSTDEPPLGLDLYYLIAAYGPNEDEIASHQLLGRVMSLLNDHKTLTAAEVATATRQRLPQSNLHEQLEGLSIVPQALSFEDLSKIWQVAQAQYRTSVAYQISVVILDSSQPIQVALPVLPQMNGHLRRGSQPLVGMGIPALKVVRLPHHQRTAQWGDRLTLEGSLLDAPDLSVQLQHSLLSEPQPLPLLTPPTSPELQVQLPRLEQLLSSAAQWVAGLYTIAVVRSQQEGLHLSEALPLAIAPQILEISPRRAPSGNLEIQLTCLPPLRPSQQVVLLLGDRGVLPQARSVSGEQPAAPTLITFRVRNLSPGRYVVRLRVDGVDSIPVDFATQPDAFDPRQIIEVTET